MNTTIQTDMRTDSLVKADGLITGIICDTIFSKAAATNISSESSINYDTGAYILKYIIPPTAGVVISMSYLDQDNGHQFVSCLARGRIVDVFLPIPVNNRPASSICFLSKIENDKMGPPAADNISRLAEILGADSDELLALAGKVPKGLGETLKKSEGARMFYRSAKDMDLSEADWQKLLQDLKRMKKSD